jgi:bacillithiol system protein YtxJ
MELTRITSEEQLAALLDPGADAPAFILKHSTACPISASAKARFEQYAAANEAAMPPCCILLVIEDRPLSNRVAESLGVQHQSPQLILVKGGEAVWSASHNGIAPERIDESRAHWEAV